VPGRWGVPAMTAAGRNSITSISSSVSVSGTSGRIATPRPRLRHARSATLHRRTFAWGGDNSSSIGAPSARAILISTVSDGLPSPDSRLDTVERGTPAAAASACCVIWRTWRRLTRFRARCAAASAGASIRSSFVHFDGHATPHLVVPAASFGHQQESTHGTAIEH
jgi:hypothetical protein